MWLHLTNKQTNKTKKLEYKSKAHLQGQESYVLPQNEMTSEIRVITKLSNSEQSYKGKVKTHKYINRQNQSTTGKL